MFYDLKCEMNVRFIDIGEIVNRNCLNFLFKNMFKCY